MEIIDVVIEYLTSLPNFQDIAIGLIFLIGVIPFIPIPQETLMIPLLLLMDETDIESVKMRAISAMIIGEFIAHTLAYYIAKHHLHKLLSMFGYSSAIAVKEKTWLHKYGKFTFLVLPSIVIFTFLTDVGLIIMAHKRVPYKTLVPYVIGGELIRAILFTYGIIFVIK